MKEQGMHVHAGIPVQGVPDEAVFPARQGIDDQCFDGFPPAGDAEGRGVIIVHPFLGLDREFEFQRFRPFLFYFPQNRVGYLPWAGMVTVRVTVFPVSLEVMMSVVRVSLPSVLLMVKGICTVSPMMP